LDQSEYETLLCPIDQMIAKSEPRQAEYWRGYREGIRFRFQDNTWASYRDHDHLHEIADRIDCDSPAVAYAREHPEHTPHANEDGAGSTKGECDKVLFFSDK
jgi:hypothetical protein